MNSDNIERYDRQIRLWGHHGQSKCSNSKICLINANSLGTEVLKGLCLAGIASFTILDSHKLTHEDVGSIFVPQTSLGKNRAETVRQMLLDLNDQVTGEVYPLETYLPHDTSPSQNQESNATFDAASEPTLNFWKQFNCIVGSGFLYIDQITRLSNLCWSLNIPLILCKSIGFFGSLRSQIEEHYVIETHPDNSLYDFSLDEPFRDLKNYFDSIDLDNSSSLEAINSYPYIVIIYKYLKKWQSLNCLKDYVLPTSYEEKKNLKSLINEGLKSINKSKRPNEHRVPSNGIIEQDVQFENFLEAGKAVNSCFTGGRKLPESVERLFEHPNVKDHINSSQVSSFWLIIRAVKHFVYQKNNGRLPISGSIPDMTSGSKEYIKLLDIFAKKAQEDVDSVFSIVQSLVSSNGHPAVYLHDETKLICKNIRDIKVISSSRISDEYSFNQYHDTIDDIEDDYLAIDLGLKALDLFFSTYGRLPGRQLVETDIGRFKDCFRQIFCRASKFKNLDEFLYELCRYGGAELHATSAFMGGCVAQEVIKFVTNQYTPVNDTLVYDAMKASAYSFKFIDTFSK